MKLCFVVHRYAPFPGGSEYYVQWMAEECQRRGHEVTVFTGKHDGDLNGVRVTSDGIIFNESFDLIVVHGGDVHVQNAVLSAIPRLTSPVLYLIIKPSDSPVCQLAMNYAAAIGCSTIEDWDHVSKYKAGDRAYVVRHGIDPNRRTGTRGLFREKYGIPNTTRLFLSCGGYWPNKRMRELAQTFEQANLENAILVTTGYDNSMDLMPTASSRVLPLMLERESDVANAIADADVYIMNSSEEGFGLVLLECMLNQTPWIARNIAGARLLKQFGTVYESESQLKEILKTYTVNCEQLVAGSRRLHSTHLIGNTVDDILAVATLKKTK
jgi:glycosyltransferase involved in cell wall biosynthesis